MPGQSSPAEEAPAVSLLNIPAAAGSGTQEDPYRLGEEQLSTSGKTVIGISEDWLDSVGATAEDPVYVTVSLPSGYDTLEARAFQHTDDSSYYLLGATWPGEYDYKTIGDYAFEGQDQLQYITMEGYENLVPDLGYDEDYEDAEDLRRRHTRLEIPSQTWEIGDYAFANCFAEEVETAVYLSGILYPIGDYAFYNGDLGYNPIKQIVCMTKSNNLSRHGTHCFAFEGDAGDRMIILADQAAYNTVLTGQGRYGPLNWPQNVKDSLSYKVTVTFEGKGSEEHLFGYSLRYAQTDKMGARYYYVIDRNYSIPEPPEPPSTAQPGYAYGWYTGGGNLVNANYIIGPADVSRSGSVALTAKTALQKPEILPTLGGQAQGSAGSTPYALTVTLTDQQPQGSIGIQASHPLTLDQQGTEDGEYVYFTYCWWDECDGSVEGPRSEEESFFSTSADYAAYHHGNETSLAEIPITEAGHARTGGDCYMVEILGYHVQSGGTPELFYKSHNNFISFITDSDILATVGTCYRFQVEVDDSGLSDPSEPSGPDQPGKEESGTGGSSSSDGQTRLNVRIHWDDGSNAAGLRPQQVLVQLYRNGAAYGEPLALGAEENWRHTWEKLDDFYRWTVGLAQAPQGYAWSVEPDQWIGYLITASLTEPLPEAPQAEEAPDRENPHTGR